MAPSSGALVRGSDGNYYYANQGASAPAPLQSFQGSTQVGVSRYATIDGKESNDILQDPDGTIWVRGNDGSFRKTKNDNGKLVSSDNYPITDFKPEALKLAEEKLIEKPKPVAPGEAKPQPLPATGTAKHDPAQPQKPSPVRAEAANNFCEEQAKKLPFEIKDGKMVLDLKNDDVKKFVKKFTPKLEVVNELLGNLWDKNVNVETRLKELQAKDSSKFKEVKELLALVPPGKYTPEIANAANKIFGFPEGFLISKGGYITFNPTEELMGKLKPEDQKYLIQLQQDAHGDKGAPNKNWQDLYDFFNGSNEESWRHFCFPCAFATGGDLKKPDTKK